VYPGGQDVADEYVFTAHDVHDNDDPNPDDENPPRHEHVTDPDSDPLKLGQALQVKDPMELEYVLAGHFEHNRLDPYPD
jgi:hypothetical protein